jgi:hypothetical protein
MTQNKDELLPLHDIKSLIKPKAEVYQGLQAVPISDIAGSEGRYRDFNSDFLPRHSHLRERWVRVDMAHHSDTILPPIKLYELGGVYFVRDGNHRVSVAVAQNAEFIDAEVTKLDTDVELEPGSTKEDIKKALIELEKKKFYGETGISEIRPHCEINFTETGRYDDLQEHINVHKYYMNKSRDHEISFEEALLSWYDNLYRPIIEAIREESILPRFPGRTEGDLYIWILRHWDELKKEYGEGVSIRTAAKSFSEKHGKISPRSIIDWLKAFFSTKE